MFKVGIIQDYVPAYRKSFFQLLRSRLERENIELNVLSHLPLGKQKARKDFTDLEIIEKFPQVQISLLGRTLVFPKNISKFTDYDALIGPLRGSSFSTAAMILHCILHEKPFGLWGHVKNYVNTDNSFDLYIEKKQMELATSIFTYTESGKEFGINRGIRKHKFFVLNNTFDTSNLREESKKITPLKIKSFMRQYNLTENKTLLYLGGLDASKRIDFLIASLDILFSLDSKIKLLVIGDGSDKKLIELRENLGQIHLLDRKNQETKVIASSVSNLILMPGRIGLVAIDSLFFGIPIATTTYRFHAPEFEYLIEGISKFTSPMNTPESYAQLVFALLNKSTNLRFESKTPSIENMVESFCQGIIEMKNL